MKDYSYEDLMRCVEILGVDKTFTKKALEILIEYRDASEDVIFPLIKVLGESAFTEEAKKMLE